MVKSVVVKGGGAGMGGKVPCDVAKAAFGIKSGKYKDLEIEDGQNREHGGAPASAFYESGRGNAGDVPMSGCGGYNPDNAWTWAVEDGQSHYTEHRFLTDKVAEFQHADGGGQPIAQAARAGGQEAVGLGDRQVGVHRIAGGGRFLDDDRALRPQLGDLLHQVARRDRR